jgi:hypothetical protein
MRKLCLPLTLIAIASAAIAIGCEDGPDQTFQPAPAAAAGNWNNGNVDAAVVTGVSTSFDSGYPTVNAVTLCSTDFKRARWAWMLTQPIEPPRKYAGIDLAKDDLWDGLTIDEAESPPTSPDSPEGGLCQSTPFGFQGTCPSGIGGCNGNSWGNNSEVGFSWNITTHILDQMTLNLGYTGAMLAGPYPDHTGTLYNYSIAVGDVYRRSQPGGGPATAPFEINWNSSDDRGQKITDIFNAVMFSYSQKAGIPFNTASCTDDSTCAAPGQKNSCQCVHNATGTTTGCVGSTKGQCGVADCATDGNCLVYTAGGETIFGIRPMVVYVEGIGGVPQPALSTPTTVYNFFTKWEPYSYLNQLVTLDANGPTATGVPVGTPKGSTITCTQQIGQTFSNLTTNCVQVTGDIKTNPTSGVDAVNLDKILHGLSHDQEHWTANVLGVNQNFTSGKVAANPDIVVLDTDVPGPTDIAQDYEFDLRARGVIANDYNAAGDVDMRGSSLMMIEWARILLEDVAVQLSQPGPWNPTGAPVKPKKLGDPSCVGYNADHVPNYVATNANPATFGCTGIEGLIIPSDIAYGGSSDFSMDPGIATADPLANLNPTNNYDELGFYAPVLKPGDIYGALCIDADGYSDCTDSLALWSNMLNQVVRVLGNGNVNNLPYNLQDRRYYFKWFGTAFIRYLKAYGNYKTAYPTTVNNFPNGTVGGGLGPSDVVKTQIDLEALFFDYSVAPGAGGAQSYDKFEYVDRTTIGTGVGGTDNYIPWDFEYGCDLLGGNQRYDNWFRRMDREEIGMYSSMLETKTDTAGKENNVNITNLFGSTLLNGNPTAGVPGVWSSYACAIGQAGDPAANCGNNPPLDPLQTGMPACGAACAAPSLCTTGNSYENGLVQACAIPCDFTTYPASGCLSPSQVCVNDLAGGGEGCMAAMMDKNVGTPLAKPLLAHYPGAWSRTPFSAGHSPITLAQSDKHPEIGVAHVNVPNFKDGPYTNSPQAQGTLADGGTGCPAGWTTGADLNCKAPQNSGTGALASAFNPLTPWLEVSPAIGFPIAIDGQRDQWITSGQFDYTGVLESYIVDYRPWVDTLTPGCVGGSADGGSACSPGYTCNLVTKNCEASDNTVQIVGIEGNDFLGQAFLCQDPSTGDVLHVGMYDSALQIVNWLAAHPGSESPFASTSASAQSYCQIILRRSPYNNYIDEITSKLYGVNVNISGGQGLGRITDIVLFDPSLIQAL